MIILQNCGDEDVTMPKCSNIRYIENVNNPYLDQISEGKTNEWEGKVSVNAKLPELEPMSHDINEIYLPQAKINVPIDEKSQCKDLLCKHYDMFSKDKTDLGKANNFEQKSI
jgi:hypothetical protein